MAPWQWSTGSWIDGHGAGNQINSGSDGSYNLLQHWRPNYWKYRHLLRTWNESSKPLHVILNLRLPPWRGLLNTLPSVLTSGFRYGSIGASVMVAFSLSWHSAWHNIYKSSSSNWAVWSVQLGPAVESEALNSRGCLCIIGLILQ